MRLDDLEGGLVTHEISLNQQIYEAVEALQANDDQLKVGETASINQRVENSEVEDKLKKRR